MKKFAIIVAGGNGTRIGDTIPKQFIELAGIPILMHTIHVFHKYDENCTIILVLPEKHIEYWRKLCNKYEFNIPHKIVIGGKERFHSVKNGLSEVEPESIVFVHDGVRPLVSQSTLKRCFQKAKESGSAIPVMPIAESLRKIDGDNNSSVDRNKFFSVQTPQTFKSEIILSAYSQDYSKLFTDDASVVENAGNLLHTVQGNPENIKITLASDLRIAESLLIE